MANTLTGDQTATVSTLLGVGKTVTEICNFVDLPAEAVTKIARSLDLEPDTKTKRRAKELFASPDGLTYADVAQALQKEKLTNDGQPVHYLTVARWVVNYGWAWGGSDDGDYNPERSARAANRSKYTLRMSDKLMAEINSDKAIRAAADAAWRDLKAEETTVVAVAVVRGAASAGVTDLREVKARLMDTYGEEIRSARV